LSKRKEGREGHRKKSQERKKKTTTTTEEYSLLHLFRGKRKRKGKNVLRTPKGVGRKEQKRKKK